MIDILEKLYLGEIRPAEKDIAGNDMKEKYRKMIQAEEEMLKSLNDQSQELFHQYLSVSDDIHTENVMESYIDGFKTAVKLILAGFTE